MLVSTLSLGKGDDTMRSKFVHRVLIVTLLASTACNGWMDGSDGARGTDSALKSLQCNAKALEVIVKGRENRFGLDGQQVALNPSIPMERICKQVAASCTSSCLTAKARAEQTGVRGFQDTDPVRLRQMGELADTFNAAQGLETNFKALGAAPEADDAGQVSTCKAKLLQVIVQGAEHRFGFDNRQVALNPAIPMANICQAVDPSCRGICEDARIDAIATGIKGFTGPDDARKLREMGELADDFNAALGNESNFGSVEVPAGGGNAGGAPPPVACSAKTLQVIVKGREYRFGFDNRQVALNPAIPIANICQGVNAGCKATCESAKSQALASGIKGFTGNPDPAKLRLMGQLADAFNLALGNASNFTANALIDK